MSFYYSSGQPPQDEPPGGFKETLTIIFAVFRVLAIPVAVMFGGIFALVGLVYLFVFSKLAGLAVIGILLLLLVARAVWEAKHPPDFTKW
ncbi:MAG: hypothetical protein ABI782_00730 [Anaerolineaceae bacterium]